MLQKQVLHLLDSSMTLVLAVRFVQFHTDLSNVVAFPIQPEHLVAELANGAREPLELVTIAVVDLLHLFFYMQKVRGHVALHLFRDDFVDIVHRSKIPLILPGFDFDESIVVTSLHDRVVHRKRSVEEDVRDVLRQSVFPESHRVLHSIQIVRLLAQAFQNLFAEVDVDRHVSRVVDVRGHVVGRVVDHRRELFRRTRCLRRGGLTNNVSNVIMFRLSSVELTTTHGTHVPSHSVANPQVVAIRVLVFQLFVAFVTPVHGLFDILRILFDILRILFDILRIFCVLFDILRNLFDISRIFRSRVRRVSVRIYASATRFSVQMSTQIELPCGFVRAL
jgi:plasmid stability protein